MKRTTNNGMTQGNQNISACRHRKMGNSLSRWMGVIAAASLTSAASAQIVINEVMADNRGAVENGPDFPDYIELHNTSGAPVTVGNMSVTDDPALPRKYVIPAGLTIAANSYLILWCDSNAGSPGLHTGFGLGASTDRVQLYAADGVTLRDDVSFGISVGNLSIGRIPNGTGTWTLNQPTPLASNTAQTLGARSMLRLNEWMASPATGEDWIEVYNTDPLPVALAGLVLTDSLSSPPNRAVPGLSFIGGNGYVQFFASNLEETDADHLDFRLGAGGETLSIYESNRVTVLDRVIFGAQTANTSQGRAPDGSDNIVFFATGASTPEAPNQIALTNVVISEVLTHTDPPLEDAIELQNLTGSPVDISYWWLSDSTSNFKKYQIPSGTVIPAYGFRVFYQNQFDAGANPFSLNSAEGDQVFLSSGNSSNQLTGAQAVVSFGALRNGVSVGRYRTSVGVDFVALSQRTFGVDNPTTLNQFRTGTGLTNAGPRIGPVVISEIYYAPSLTPVGDEDEFIEFHNPSGIAVPMYDVDYPTNAWRIRDGITFNFPLNLTLAAGGYLVVVSFDPVADPAKLQSFRTRFSVPETVPVLGPFTGRISNTGETLRSQVADHPEPTGMVPYETVEAITYSSTAPWPSGAVETGLSLHRTSVTSYGNEPTNWFAAAPNPGRGNTTSNDSDSDGMPNDWETANGFNPNSAADAAEDADADGATNLSEYRAGTNPRSAQSALRFTSVIRSGGVVQLKFSAISGKSYTLESRAQLGSGNWGFVSTINSASTGEMTVNLPAPAGSMQYYRLVLVTP